MGLFLRALGAFLLLPGSFAFLIPLTLVRSDEDGPFTGTGAWAVLALGIALLLWCVSEFYRAGRGTLAPWSPPRRLVTSGPYAYTRNPMYIAILLILGAWAWGFRSVGLAVYAAAFAAAFQIRVVGFEEPWLARTHGEAWTAYRDRVPRWIGRPRGPVTRGRSPAS